MTPAPLRRLPVLRVPLGSGRTAAAAAVAAAHAAPCDARLPGRPRPHGRLQRCVPGARLGVRRLSDTGEDGGHG